VILRSSFRFMLIKPSQNATSFGLRPVRTLPE
jgi:hypothetical protein